MDHWLELAVAACDHTDLQVGSIETLGTWEKEHGENAVYRLDDQWILKIYGPTPEWRYVTERAALRTLATNPTIPVPRVVADGELPGGLPYLVLTAVEGAETAEVWQGMVEAEQLAVAEEIGALMAAVHRLPQKELAAVEQQPGGRNEQTIRREEARRTGDVIAATETLSVSQRDDLLRFLHEEAPEHLHGPPKFTHFDLSHHHVTLARETGAWRVSGIIDWAEAALGPPEWDVVCLWHWTFNGVWQPTYTADWEAMRACLRTFYAGGRPPERFARRCLAAFLISPWVSLIWPHFLEQQDGSQDIVRDLTAYCFAPQVFGPPD